MIGLVEYIISESRIIKNRKFLNMLEKAGFKDVHLEEDSGTVYVSDDEGISASYMSDHAWYGTRFKDQSAEQWVLDVAIKYLNEVDEEDLELSKTIHPNFEYLEELASSLPKDSSYYIKKLNEYRKK